MLRPENLSKDPPSSLPLYFIEAKELNYNGEDKVCCRLLTTITVGNFEIANMCVEWHSWRWLIEEVFKILTKEGYNIEGSELESTSSVRKSCLLIMETVIKLFLMRLAYTEPEVWLSPQSCFGEEEVSNIGTSDTKIRRSNSQTEEPLS